MYYYKDGCKFVKCDYLTITDYLFLNDSILIKPFIGGKIGHVVRNQKGSDYEIFSSNSFVPFDHDFIVDNGISSDIKLVKTVTNGNVKTLSNNTLMLGKFLDISKNENLRKIIYLSTNGGKYNSCGFLIKREFDNYITSLTMNSYNNLEKKYTDISFISSFDKNLIKSIYKLEMLVNSYNCDDIIDLILNQYNENLSFGFDVDSKKLRLIKR